MAESCVFKPTVRNKEGNEVESRLFNDLLHYSSNDREFAKRWYFVGTNESFLDSNRDSLDYDENGEVTFRSLKSSVELGLDRNKVLEGLNRDLGSGEHDYGKAVSLVSTFNSTSQYNDEYMAVMSPVTDGKSTINVVERTGANELSLEESITNKELFDRIKDAVESVGGSVSFIDDRYSRYDTVNAQRAESGLYNVISLSRKGNLTDDMAEEAGHFAVGALGDNPIVKRLESLLTPEVQESILGDHYSDVQGRRNPARETMGYLVGRAIRSEVDRQSAIGRLADRIVGMAKRMFHKLMLDDVGRMREEAVMAAKDIARGFMSGNNAGTIENALRNKEMLYSASDSTPVSAFKDVIRQLNLLTTEMSNVDKTTYRKWHAIEADTAIGRLFENPSVFADLIALDGIAVALTQLADNLPVMIDMLDSIDYEMQNVPKNAKKLRQVGIYVRSALAVMNIVDNMLTSENLTLDESVKDNLTNAYNALSSLLKGSNRLEVNLLKKQRKLYLKFLQDVYGGKYVERAARVVFHKEGMSLERLERSRESIERMLESLDEDDGFMCRYLASMADSSDIINQIAYKAKAAANKVADNNTLKAWDDIRVLEAYAKEHKIDTDRILERDDEGNLTGNYISEYNWGKWENDWIEFKKKAKEDFLKDPSINGKTQIEREFMWDTYFRPMAKQWHKAHSVYDKEEGRHLPGKMYENSAFSDLTDDERAFLKRVLEIKEGIDSMLDYTSANGEVVNTAHTTLYRMPQFRGSTQNRIENMKRSMSLGKSIGKALRQNLVSAFTVDSEDRDYGSAATHNVIDEDVFSDKLDFEKEKMRRIPLYGINKLRDMSQLSTDVFNGLLQYAAMASSYQAASSVVDILETGKNVLSNRRVAGLKREVDRDKKSRVFNRYCDFLDAQVYNLYASNKIKFGKVAMSKVIGTLNGFASKLFLGGNVAGGMVNAMTGFNEMLKEAIAGETYTMGDFRKANAIYFKYLPAIILQSGKGVKNDKVSLFAKRFNTQNSLDSDAREWSTRKTRLERLNPFGDNLMMPYKSGDHYMQTLSYLAAAQHYMFVDSTGSKMSMWDALEEVDIDKGHPEAGKRLEFKEGVRYIDKTGNPREWTFDDELEFTSLCRETNNRMHGIYNRSDKTAFHQALFGQMMLAMKGYALGLAYRRLSANHYNISLGRESEGTLVTAGKLILNMFGGKGQFLPSLRALLCPFGKSVRSSMLEMGFSDEQYVNMRRNWGDYTLIGLLFILKLLTAKPEGGDDDDDNDDTISGLAYYFASRLYMEQNAYNTPWGMWTEQKSVLDWVPSGVSAVVSMINIAELAVTGEEYKQDSEMHDKGDKKWKYKASGYIPYYRSTRVLEHPYKSAEAYEIGRSTYK